MSYGPLPKRVDPRKLAEREAQLQGTIDLESMPELCSLLVDNEGKVSVELGFALDQQKLRTVIGHANARVKQQCQRCLEAVEVDLHAEFNLAVVLNEEQAKNLPRYYDPLLVEEDVVLASLVEEELILTLPAVAYHDDCSVQLSFGEDEVQQSEQDEKPNPFSVLASLKAKR